MNESTGDIFIIFILQSGVKYTTKFHIILMIIQQKMLLI